MEEMDPEVSLMRVASVNMYQREYIYCTTGAITCSIGLLATLVAFIHRNIRSRGFILSFGF